MNLRKGFRIATWIFSLIAFVGFGVLGIITHYNDPYSKYWEFYITAFVSFVVIWLIYWVIHGIIQGFHKIGKKKVLQIIKWAAIIFFASILFHLADHVVHKIVKSIESKTCDSVLDFDFE